MNLIAFTEDLSIASFIGFDIGTKVEVVSKETFYSELDSPLFRGVYQSHNSLLTLKEHQNFFKDKISDAVISKLNLVDRVFQWTKEHSALYHIEYTDLPDQINPPVYLRITKLEHKIEIPE